MKKLRYGLFLILLLAMAGVVGAADAGPVFEEDLNGPPDTFVLYQNYPNPFNPNTTIKFEIKEAQQISLKVYDLLAREVAVLVDDYKEVGIYDVSFDASDLPSGIYFYSIQTSKARVVRQMTLMK